MPDSESRELTLYIQSKKAITSFYRPPAAQLGGPDASYGGRAGERSAHADEEMVGTGREAFFLSDDQARCLALTEEVSRKRGYTLHVTDVAKAGTIERLVAERLKGVERFPVLLAPGNQRIEGVDEFTEERLCEVMPAEMSTLRAFTYVKVKGGDLDRIREQVLGFAEVRELHLLTGDWDVFMVLEFPSGPNKKRQILDFVTERIRGIPEVVDTSTLVPEFSVSKFPF